MSFLNDSAPKRTYTKGLIPVRKTVLATCASNIPASPGKESKIRICHPKPFL